MVQVQMLRWGQMLRKTGTVLVVVVDQGQVPVDHREETIDTIHTTVKRLFVFNSPSFYRSDSRCLRSKKSRGGRLFPWK